MPYYRSIPRSAVAQPASVYIYMGIFPRYFAAVLDGFILGVPTCMVGWVLVFVLSKIVQTEQSAVIIATLMLLGIVGLIATALEAGGGTPGKRILGLRIIDSHGNKPGFGRALIRNLLRIVDFLPFGYMLGIILVASSERKQRLGDKCAGTYVVGREK